MDQDLLCLLAGFWQISPPELSLRLKGCADESVYPASEWLQALSYLHLVLKMNNQIMALDDAIGFLNCCSEEAGRELGIVDFVDTVKDFVAQYGIERATN